MNDSNPVGMTITMEQIQNEYDEFIDARADINIYTRSRRLQEQATLEIDEYVSKIKGFKAQAVSRGDERAANLFFHFQCMLRSLESSLKVWVAIKSEDFSSAWSRLVDAQEYKDVALKIFDYPGARHLEQRLFEMESALFPGWSVYNSAGFTETIGRCSICSAGFGDCDHIENFVYMGSLCRRVDREFIEANHSAIVKNPRDRRCIVTKMSNDNGKMVDRFTLEEAGDKREDTDATLLEGILFTTTSLDFD